jgi:hypothetical protein
MGKLLRDERVRCGAADAALDAGIMSRRRTAATEST